MKLLVVSPRAFASGWGADTPRLLQMARGLVRLGWTVDVLRCRHPHEPEFSAVIQAFSGQVITAPFFGPFSTLCNHKGLRRIVRFFWKLRGYVELDDYPALVASRLVRFARNERLPRPDAVFGFSGGQLESFVSARHLSTHFQCPLIVEYRDPIPHPGSPPLDSEKKALLQQCIAQASLVITTTKGLSKRVAEEFPFAADKVRTIYSSFDDEIPTPVVKAESNERLVLVHAGVLYGGKGRNARSLVAAIAEAVKLDPSIRNRIQLRLIGAGKGGAEAAELASQLGVSWAVELVAQMSHRECLEALDEAQVLVVIKFDDPDFDQQIPGKVFQYLGRGKPLLGIMRETEAAEIIRGSGLGLVFDHSNVAGTARALIDLFKNVGDLQSKFKPNPDYIGQFSLREMAVNFDRELSASVARAAQSAGAGIHALDSNSPNRQGGTLGFYPRKA